MMPKTRSGAFFFNDTATTEIYTLSLHDALPIFRSGRHPAVRRRRAPLATSRSTAQPRSGPHRRRSEEHTSELQSHVNLVCRLLLEKKKQTSNTSSVSHNTKITPNL